MDNYELVHHGIPGMKWGIRRYQNRDGSLTAAGKKRYDKEVAKLKAEEKIVRNKERTKAKFAKLEEQKRSLEERKRALNDDTPTTKTTSTGKKTTSAPTKLLSDMSDQELQTVVNRMNLEARYKQLNPEKVSRGKKFLQKITGEVVVPAATEVSRNALKKWMQDAVDKASKTKK